MRIKFFIIPAALIFQVAGAQNGPAPLTVSQGTLASITVTPSTPVTLNDPATSTEEGDTYINYKSVYEAATLEEEVQMAAERFNLTKSQQDVWMTAAVDRRKTEKEVYEKLSSKDVDYSKDAVYRGLRMSHNTFHEIVVGHLNPAQKQALEEDRAILHEKQRRLAKLSPPPAPTVTVAPVDSAAIKEQILKEAEKIKAAEKKSKAKKKKKSAS
jgi:hypothetical protein